MSNSALSIEIVVYETISTVRTERGYALYKYRVSHIQMIAHYSVVPPTVHLRYQEETNKSACKKHS